MRTKRPYNFGAGPATLPESILKEAQAELLDWQGLGMSILETGHRTVPFQSLLEQAEADLRELLAIPQNYHILFLGEPARSQFAMIPMNLIAPGQQAGYLISGVWSQMAYDECKKISHSYVVGCASQSIPEPEKYQFRDNTAYVYYTPNETIDGVRFNAVPKIDNIPLVADMTSCILSEPININNYGLIFAGAQKNIASAGLTIVIVRDDLLKPLSKNLPTLWDYHTHITNKSLYATPPTFNCYLAAKMFQWIKEQGGVRNLYQLNCQKAEKLYRYLDESNFYKTKVARNARSLMNICFSLEKTELEPLFLEQASLNGLIALKGHRLVGGIRASLYNAMPMAGVDALIAFMEAFSEEYAV